MHLFTFATITAFATTQAKYWKLLFEAAGELSLYVKPDSKFAVFLGGADETWAQVTEIFTSKDEARPKLKNWWSVYDSAARIMPHKHAFLIGLLFAGIVVGDIRNIQDFPDLESHVAKIVATKEFPEAASLQVLQEAAQALNINSTFEMAFSKKTKHFS